jgi:hypothetical protein
VTLPYTKQRWVSAALWHQDMLVCGDRGGSVHVYKCEGSTNKSTEQEVGDGKFIELVHYVQGKFIELVRGKFLELVQVIQGQGLWEYWSFFIKKDYKHLC